MSKVLDGKLYNGDKAVQHNFPVCHKTATACHLEYWGLGFRHFFNEYYHSVWLACKLLYRLLTARGFRLCCCCMQVFLSSLEAKLKKKNQLTNELLRGSFGPLRLTLLVFTKERSIVSSHTLTSKRFTVLPVILKPQPLFERKIQVSITVGS